MAQNPQNQLKATGFKYPYNYGNMQKEEIINSFVTVLNIAKPEHPYLNNPYPLKTENIEYGYKKASSSMYASCGPRNNRNRPVSFSADKSKFNQVEPERILAINTHEVTHVTVGSHSDKEHGGHPPRFWREFGFNAHQVLDKWDQIRVRYGNVSKKDYIGYIVKKEVNPYNIDRRYGDVMHRRQEMARWFEQTLKH